MDFWMNFMKLRFFCVLEHVETIICYKFICIDIKLGSNPQLREDLHFAIDSLLSSQAKLWGLFTRPTFSTTSSFVILCTEAWIQGCVCKASALGGSMWDLLKWLVPVHHTFLYISRHAVWYDHGCGVVPCTFSTKDCSYQHRRILTTFVLAPVWPLNFSNCSNLLTSTQHGPKLQNKDSARSWRKPWEIYYCSFLVVPRWRECLPPLPASISLLCSSRLGQQSCALWSRILGPWTLKGAESTEEVRTRNTGNWNHKDIRHIGTPKKKNMLHFAVFCMSLGFTMVLSCFMAFRGTFQATFWTCEQVSVKILMTWESMIFQNLLVFTTKLEFQDVPSLFLWVCTVYV